VGVNTSHSYHNINTYLVHEKEMTAVIHYLQTWSHYLLGKLFVIKIDNITTSYFMMQPKLPPMDYCTLGNESISLRRPTSGGNL
jgi:hypothetical protein